MDEGLRPNHGIDTRFEAPRTGFGGKEGKITISDKLREIRDQEKEPRAIMVDENERGINDLTQTIEELTGSKMERIQLDELESDRDRALVVVRRLLMDAEGNYNRLKGREQKFEDCTEKYIQLFNDNSKHEGGWRGVLPDVGKIDRDNGIVDLGPDELKHLYEMFGVREDVYEKREYSDSDGRPTTDIVYPTPYRDFFVEKHEGYIHGTDRISNSMKLIVKGAGRYNPIDRSLPPPKPEIDPVSGKKLL